MDKIISFVILALITFLCFKAEDLIDLAMNNTPWIVVIFLIISAIIIAFVVIKNLISNYELNPIKTKKICN